MKKIIVIWGLRVMIDADLAELYGVPTKRLNEQVKRNIKRFPEDFMFQLTEQEKNEVVANCDHLEKLKYSPNNSSRPGSSGKSRKTEKGSAFGNDWMIRGFGDWRTWNLNFGICLRSKLQITQ